MSKPKPASGQLKDVAKAEGAFVMLELELLASPPWRGQSINCRRLIERLMIEHLRHAGTENGELVVTWDQFVEHGITRRLIAATLAEAVIRGLLEIEEGHYRGGARTTPSKYRLTFCPGVLKSDLGRRYFGKATHEWKRVKPAAKTVSMVPEQELDQYPNRNQIGTRSGTKKNPISNDFNGGDQYPKRNPLLYLGGRGAKGGPRHGDVTFASRMSPSPSDQPPSAPSASRSGAKPTASDRGRRFSNASKVDSEPAPQVNIVGAHRSAADRRREKIETQKMVTALLAAAGIRRPLFDLELPYLGRVIQRGADPAVVQEKLASEIRKNRRFDGPTWEPPHLAKLPWRQIVESCIPQKHRSVASVRRRLDE